MTDIVIVAARTAVGKFSGTIARSPRPSSAAAVNLLERAKLTGDQVGGHPRPIARGRLR
jgi:acetyl-CoA C-acetyltransferase